VLLKAAAAVALAVIAAGCGGGSKPERTTSLAPGCEVDRIAKIVNGFLGAVNSGDRARLGGFVSVSPSFLIHDGTGKNEQRVHLTRRSGVLRYFAERHRLHEHARMISLRVAPGIDANHVLIDFRLTRTAADFPRRGITARLASGTARVNCVTDRVERLLIQGP